MGRSKKEGSIFVEMEEREESSSLRLGGDELIDHPIMDGMLFLDPNPDIKPLSHVSNHTPRLISRSEGVNLQKSMRAWTHSLFGNVFHTSLTLSWRSTLIIVAAIYMCTFLLSGLIYFFLNYKTKTGEMCIANVETYHGCFFFAVQTQMTIGYGNSYPENSCYGLIAAVTVHSIIGLLLDALVLGVVYARFSIPEKRGETIILSEKAVILEEEGETKLLIRLANIHASQVLDPRVRLILHRLKFKSNGERVVEFEDLPLASSSDWYFFALPILLTHIINEESPLYGISSDKIVQFDPEIIVVVDGVDSTTSDSVQVLHSYKREEILFDHYFPEIIHVNVDSRGQLRYYVDYENFNVLKQLSGQENSEEKREEEGLWDEPVDDLNFP